MLNQGWQVEVYTLKSIGKRKKLIAKYRQVSDQVDVGMSAMWSIVLPICSILKESRWRWFKQLSTILLRLENNVKKHFFVWFIHDMVATCWNVHSGSFSWFLWNSYVSVRLSTFHTCHCHTFTIQVQWTNEFLSFNKSLQWHKF